ncbi:MAG: TetR/AcrR family transcriptional regulator [Nevskiales bacterium]
MPQGQRNNRKARADTREYAQVKQRMVNAAIELMEGDGFRKFRFEELAEKVGYNRATLYRYFDSKQELTTEVMMTLMQEITLDIISKTAGNRVSRETFTTALFDIIKKLHEEPRYAIVMDAQNIETFARLTHEYFSGITTTMLEKFLINEPVHPLLREGIRVSDAVPWLMHQIISYGFLGIPGDTEAQQKQYLEKMVVAVIL